MHGEEIVRWWRSITKKRLEVEDGNHSFEAALTSPFL
jgi:hypothetical protein